MRTLTLSTLPHTWLIDVDGTVLAHNGHKSGGDSLLPGVTQLWARIPEQDFIVLLSARTEGERDATLAIFSGHGLRFDLAVFALPVGERILINDQKLSGMQTARAVNVRRDAGLADLALVFDAQL